MPDLTWTKDFLDSCARRGIRPKTAESYAMILHILTNHYAIDFQNATEGEILQGLDKVRAENELSTYGAYVGFAKRALTFLNRKDVAERIENPRKPDRATKIKEQLLTDQEIAKLIQKAPTLFQRLLVELLSESGAREGEIVNLKIRDVQFDEYSAILSLTGKTGTRKRRIFAAVPDLRRYLNDHPQRTDPNAALFLNKYGRPLTENRLYGTIRELGYRILEKPIHPHQFRHSRATADSRNYTDREMMMLFGWDTPEMIGVYSHLSMRDVDDKELVLHGLKRREEILKPLVQIQRCAQCNEENAPLAMYCLKCGSVLSNQSNVEMILQDQKFIQGLAQNPVFIDALRKALKS